MDSLSLRRPNEDVRERGARFEDEDGVGLAGLVLFGTHLGCCGVSFAVGVYGGAGILTVAVVAPHVAVVAGSRGDRDGGGP